MDATSSTLIVTLVTSFLNLVLSLYSAHKQKHFSSSCSSCCKVSMDDTDIEQPKS